MISFRSIIFCLFMLALPIGPPWTQAAPVRGDACDYVQPDGASISLRLWGDEFYRVGEAADGYTVVQQPDGWFCYARLAADGRELLSTGIRVGLKDSPTKLAAGGLAPHLRLPENVVRQKIEEARRQMEPERTIGKNAKPAIRRSVSPEVVRGIVLLVDFPDHPATVLPSAIDDMLNKPGYNLNGNQGSARDYFEAVSGGRFIYTNYVTPYVHRASQVQSYYTDLANGITRVRALAAEALHDLDDRGFDFSQYDSNHDGQVDTITLMYFGPRPFSLSALYPNGGLRVYEKIDGMGFQMGDVVDYAPTLGTFLHENSHCLLGLPDLYGNSEGLLGIGGYCLMSTGCLFTVPTTICAPLKYMLGWGNAIPLNSPASNLPLAANSFHDYLLANPANTREFYLIDIIHRSSPYCANMPDEGLVLWHVDLWGDNHVLVNTPDNHQMVGLVQADGETEVAQGGSTDLFDAASYSEVGPWSKPDTNWWDDSESGLNLHHISAIAPVMTFSTGEQDALKLTPLTGSHDDFFQGQSLPAVVALYTIATTATTAVAWTAGVDADWLMVTPAGGTVNSGAGVAISVKPTAAFAQLTPGEYSAVLKVSNPASGFSLKRKISVSIIVHELLAHWKLDDGWGTELKDSSSYGRHGTLRPDAAWVPVARFGGGLALNTKQASYAEIPRLDLNGNYLTLAAWIRRDGDTPDGSAIAVWESPETYAAFYLSRNQLAYSWDFSRYGNPVGGSLGFTIPDQSWCLAVLVIETKRATIYQRDASGLHSKVFSNTHPALKFAGAGLLGRNYVDYDSFNGLMDDVRIYSYPLDANAIEALWRGDGVAEGPEPPDGARGVKPRELRWSPAAAASGHHVYLGENAAAVRAATAASPEHRGFTLGPRLTINDRPTSRTYYWRVDEICPGGVQAGPIWSFTTASASPPLPLAHWRLDETSGTAAHDASGHGYTGTLHDTTTWTLIGRYDGAVRFSGHSGYIALPALGTNTTTMTVTGWIRGFGNTAAIRDVIYLAGENQTNFHFGFSGALVLAENDYSYHVWNANIPEYRWCFVAWTLKPGKIRMFSYNGREWAGMEYNRGSYGFVSSQEGHIGRLPHPFEPDPAYEIDDVRIYDKFLTAEEIHAVAMQSPNLAPAAASSPRPSHGAWGVDRSAPALDWMAGERAGAHDIFFGATNPPLFLKTQYGAAAFSPGALGVGDYYWRVDEANSAGTTPGPIWQFSTHPPNAAGPAWNLYDPWR